MEILISHIEHARDLPVYANGQSSWIVLKVLIDRKMLAYVRVIPETGKLLQAEADFGYNMIKEGYCVEISDKYPHVHQEEYKQAGRHSKK